MTRLALSAQQAFVLGDALFGADGPEAEALLGALDPRPQEVEDLAGGRWALVVGPLDADVAWSVLVEHANALDEQVSHRVGRGRDADGRSFLRAEIRSLQGLLARLVREARS